MSNGKKIGIITIHSVYNYGAMLQAYALNKYFMSNGFDSEIIDYQPYHLCKDYKFYKRDFILRPYIALAKIKNIIKNNGIHRNFDDFYTEEMVVSKVTYKTANSLKLNNYDILVTGSDQIWNPNIVNYDSSYLLAFSRENQKKYAYSSSFGVSTIDDAWSQEVKLNLNSYMKIGVREDIGVSILNRCGIDCDVKLVLDPVFLFNRSFWENMSSSALTPVEKYLLVYSLEPSDELILNAQAIANEKGLSIVTIHPFNARYSFADVCINNAGPKEFLSLILNAQFVVTNSFHGTVFSLIFDVPLHCVAHTSTGSRVTSLFERFKLTPQEELFDDSRIKVVRQNTYSRDLMQSAIQECKSFLNISF
ncbi:polysaccharide pyruvyl transferase family protein [Vibrio vulnificus]|nr:polysaccharide pyruvyl transferase family protein [Vibrio vulnificus]